MTPQGSGDAGSSKARATPQHGLLHGVAQWWRGPTTVVALQGTTAARLLKRRGLLQGSDGVGAGSTNAAAARFNDARLGSGSDGPRFRLGEFFYF
jgi:hypothetical protein